MTDRVGEVPAQQLGNYRLVRSLGKGGFAEVYLGEHIYLKTQAAIKVLHTKLSKDAQQSFLNEARIIAHLKHPSIVRVLEFGLENGTPFLVMSYAPDGTLRHRHPQGVPLPLPTVVSYVKQVAAALQYAHQHKLIHRDIKPQNMLLGRNGEVLLSDFGIAITARNTDSQSVQKAAGTVAYMAPEQLRGRPRLASDQYSLGVVVYEWLCGMRPFNGSYINIADSHLHTPAPPLHEKVPGISPAVEEIVLKALAKDPHQRFESVQAFADALEEACLRESALASVPTRPLSIAALSPGVIVPKKMLPGLGRRLPRRAIVAGLAGLAGLAIVGGGIGWYAYTQRPQVQSHTMPPIGTTLYIYHDHSDNVNDVVWSPDGKRIASASADKTVQVWDAVGGDSVAATGSQVLTYRGHAASVNAVTWSPDGKYIASASDDKTVQVWDAITGNQVLMYRGHFDKVTAVAWSSDSNRIASAALDGTVQVWDALTGKLVAYYSNLNGGGGLVGSPVGTLGWSPTNQLIASSFEGKVLVRNVTTGDVVLSYDGHSGAVVDGLAWSPNGQHIVSASADKTVQVWDATTGGHVFSYRGHTSLVNAAVWSTDGKRIASGSDDKTVQVWDAITGGHVFIYRGHSGPVHAVAWAPNEQHIASGGGDKTVQVWQGV